MAKKPAELANMVRPVCLHSRHAAKFCSTKTGEDHVFSVFNSVRKRWLIVQQWKLLAQLGQNFRCWVNSGHARPASKEGISDPERSSKTFQGKPQLTHINASDWDCCPSSKVFTGEYRNSGDDKTAKCAS